MIHFPKHHIATSVTNRILNVADELEANMRASAPAPAPSVPPTTVDVTGQSLALQDAIQAPTPDVPPLNQAPDPGGSVAGKPVLATMLDPKP